MAIGCGKILFGTREQFPWIMAQGAANHAEAIPLGSAGARGTVLRGWERWTFLGLKETQMITILWRDMVEEDSDILRSVCDGEKLGAIDLIDVEMEACFERERRQDIVETRFSGLLRGLDV